VQDEDQFPQHVTTPYEIEQMLARALKRLDELTTEYRRVEMDAAIAEADYRRAKGVKALAIIRGNLPAKERDARIELELDEERRVHLIAQAELHSHRELLNTIRTRIEALRSLNASVRVLATP
jgi:hypothetical protein